MKALIAGGAGFVGHNLVPSLLADGFEVTVLDDFSTGTKIEGCEVIRGSVVARRDVERATKDCDVIVNLACQSMPVSFKQPLRDVEVNVMGAVNLLNTAYHWGAKYVHVSSCSVYGAQERQPITEEAPLRPFTPYAAGKLGGESYALAYHAHGWVDSTVLRPSNIYGPHQHPFLHPGVIGRFLFNLIQNQTSTIYGSGKDKRDFTYVSDIVSAIRLAMDLENQPGPFNASHGTPFSVQEVADLIGGKYEHQATRLIDVISERTLNSDRLRAFGWKPEVHLLAGIRETEFWMREAEL